MKLKIKDEKGSITLFALTSMMLFVVVLVGLYVNSSYKMQKQQSEIKKVQKDYETVDIDKLYEEKVNEVANYTEVTTLEDLQEKLLDENVKYVALTENLNTTNTYLTINHTMTLNLNGCSFSASEPSNINKTIIVTGEDTTLTLRDESEKQNGEIICTDNGTANRVISLENKAKLIFESGTITNNNPQAKHGTIGVFLSQDCEFIMNGGEIRTIENSYASDIGVRLGGKGAKFTQNGGIIEVTKGSGISIGTNGTVDNYTTATINNGSIESKSGSGITGSSGLYIKTSVNGGRIKGTTYSIEQSQNSTLEINEGIISGLLIQNGIATMSGGRIEGDLFAKAPAKFSLNGGTITGNLILLNATPLQVSSENANIKGETKNRYSIEKDTTDSHGTLSYKVNGSVVSYADPGDEISVSATPKSGYTVTGFLVYKKGDTNTTITLSENDTFVMSDYVVRIKALYEATN